MLHAAWNLHRFRSIEVQCCSGTLADFSDAQSTTVLDRLGRYQARAQRAYYRSLQELRTLQTNRTLRAVKLDEEVEPHVPAIVDINELTKQTHSEVTAEAIKQAFNIVECQTGLLKLDAMNRAANSRVAAAAEAARAASAQPGRGAASSSSRV